MIRPTSGVDIGLVSIYDKSGLLLSLRLKVHPLLVICDEKKKLAVKAQDSLSSTFLGYIIHDNVKLLIVCLIIEVWNTSSWLQEKLFFILTICQEKKLNTTEIFKFIADHIQKDIVEIHSEDLFKGKNFIHLATFAHIFWFPD